MLRLLDEAEAEALAAGQWYEDRRNGLGVEFFEELGSGLAAVERTPLRFPKIQSRSNRQFRYYTLKRFPYQLIYEIVGDDVSVLAVAHAHRRPNYWKTRGL